MASITGALILAAGKGTRMHSDKPKVLQSILGEPMLRFVYDALEPLFGGNVWTVIGHQADMVRAAFKGEDHRFVVQEKQLGTGHALQAAWDELKGAGLDRVVVVNGDTPLLPTSTVATFLKEAMDADVAFMTLTLPDPGAYGRVVRHNRRVVAIVEAKDYDETLYGPEPDEINAGIYCLRMDAVEKLLPRLTNANKSGEYYITDLVGLAVAERMDVIGVECGQDPNLLGVNDPAELIRSEALVRARIALNWIEKRVLIHAPETVRISPRAVLEPGAELYGPCEIYGASRIARAAVVHSHCWLRDAVVAEGAAVHPFSHVEKAEIGPGCVVGPYARLRPGAVMEEGARVGNFVEMKKARLCKGAKANHLTYLGDAEVGPGANIGAGTITCNYDGAHKHQTVIGEGAFIGSNSALVAPVTIGARSLVGAGSVITKDVPDDSLAIARGRQTTMPRRGNP
ncbi:bifunctional UDP-N-acetylglucosamine diphosphorylase/glucosamine-1-phosphate N-acetyltransferase GlmU [Nitratidesulfovibrio sp. 1201_IL3209]|uniref:bifunctional UDP-N-acetylglucosamine diphosphorylase/glucosamine-1-phosphate N-acetyltransferase GlmU n=1 Tax=Nitratidesulfovibrio sp. 1201_IL3209 TaxID=3084053 RepID=UPI002FDA898A